MALSERMRAYAQQGKHQLRRQFAEDFPKSNMPELNAPFCDAYGPAAPCGANPTTAPIG
jgi:hypothetical protein